MANILNVVGDLSNPYSFITNYDRIKTSLLLVHQTNTQGVMLAGVALALSNQYPTLLPDYQSYCASLKNTEALLGSIFVHNVPSTNLCIVNLFGQHLTNNKRDTNYEAVYHSLEVLSYYIDYVKTPTLAFPCGMSSGLAGGDWKIILCMIEQVFRNKPVTIYIVEYYKGI